jgi:hypothetical protein
LGYIKLHNIIAAAGINGGNQCVNDSLRITVHGRRSGAHSGIKVGAVLVRVFRIIVAGTRRRIGVKSMGWNNI